jgi:molecular chaperone GrpE
LTEKDAAAELAAQADSPAGEGDDTGAGAGAGNLEALRLEAEENWNKYLRAVAELDNLRKRNAREVEHARKFGAERLAAAILPVRDSLEAGLKAASEAAPGSVSIEALLEGDQATLRLLDQALASAGVTEIDPEGEPFDPERHEAMSMMPSATAEPNSVIVVVQKGYMLNERVVRPARVVVAQAPPGSGQA